MQNIGGVPGAQTLTSCADALQLFKENYAEVVCTATLSVSNDNEDPGVEIFGGDDIFGGDAGFHDHYQLPCTGQRSIHHVCVRQRVVHF